MLEQWYISSHSSSIISSWMSSSSKFFFLFSSYATFSLPFSFISSSSYHCFSRCMCSTSSSNSIHRWIRSLRAFTALFICITTSVSWFWAFHIVHIYYYMLSGRSMASCLSRLYASVHHLCFSSTLLKMARAKFSCSCESPLCSFTMDFISISKLVRKTSHAFTRVY